MGLTSFCVCNRTDEQRSLVPSRFVGAGAEEWIDCVRKSICEGVDENSGLHVVEGHHPLLKVHVDPNSRRSDAEHQAGRRLGSEGVFSLIAQTEEPVAVGGAYGDLALPVDGSARHSQVPIGLPPNVHLEAMHNSSTCECTSPAPHLLDSTPEHWPPTYLPVMSPRAEALMGQHTHHPIKTFWIVGDLLVSLATEHLLTVRWDDEARMGRVGIQSDIGWRVERVWIPWNSQRFRDFFLQLHRHA